MFSRLVISLFAFMLSGSAVYATPCAQVKSELDAWVENSVNRLVLVAKQSFDNEKKTPAYNNVLDAISNTIRICKLSEDQEFTGRYRNFADYIQLASLDHQPEHNLGFLVTDREYFAQTRQFSEIPDFLLDQDFLRLVSRNETLGRAKAFLALLNSKRSSSSQLTFFSYRSRHLGTPDNDNSFLRLLIVVPASPGSGDPDKWVQFGIPDPRSRTRIRNVSVVSAVARHDGASDIYFKDFYRIYRPNGSIGIKGRWELGQGDDSCVSCHKSGILPIFPEKGSVSVSERQSVSIVNQRFLSYGAASFQNYLDLSKFGPGLGAETLENRIQRFGPTFGLTAVAHAMVCSSCHQSGGLGSLNWPMDSTLIASFIEGGPMPLGNNLRDSQRTDLYERLIREYFDISDANPGILKAWLLHNTRSN